MSRASAHSWFRLSALLLALALPLGWLPSAPAPLPPKPVKAPQGLYSDDDVRRIAGHDPGQLRPDERRFLDVVPDGETRPLGDVLKALGFDAARLQTPVCHAFRFTFSLSWRVFPSYGLKCNVEFENSDDPFDLRNKVYMVEIVKW